MLLQLHGELCQIKINNNNNNCLIIYIYFLLKWRFWKFQTLSEGTCENSEPSSDRRFSGVTGALPGTPEEPRVTVPCGGHLVGVLQVCVVRALGAFMNCSQCSTSNKLCAAFKILHIACSLYIKILH